MITETKTSAGNLWCLVDTPDPQRSVLCTFVSRENVRLRDIPTLGQTYKTWTQKLPSLVSDFGEWKYAMKNDSPNPGGMPAFFWTKPMTDEERNTPFRTTYRFGNHRWPPILKGIKFVPVPGFPLVSQNVSGTGGGASTGNVYAQRYLVREAYIPGVDEGTRFQIEEFISDQPFTIPRYPVPTPTSVTYHFLNLRGGFPECLHKKIDFGKLLGTVATSFAGAPAASYTELQGQVFPATNFTEWAPYVIEDEPVYQNGLWYRRRVRVHPPAMPEVQLSTS